MIVSFFRIIRFGFQNFLRNFWLSVATISVLIITLVSVNMLLVLNVLGKVALDTVKSRVDVSVHFKPEIEESRVQTVKIALLGMAEVKDVTYISPAEALDRFSDQYRKDLNVIESLGEVGENPFGATLVVKARQLEGYPKVITTLDDPLFANLIEEKDFEDRNAMIGKVESAAHKLEIFGGSVSLIFLFLTLLIVFNTIRVSVFTRKEEIGIMRLVGASDGFIRAPFYVEALLWSTVSIAACLAFVYPAIGLAQPMLQRFFGTDAVDLRGFYDANFLQLFGFQFLAVALIALVTTKMATAKYLKV